MKKTSVVASLENMIANIQNPEMTSAHINYIGYAIGMTIDLDTSVTNRDVEYSFLPNELKLIDNVVMRLMGPTTLELSDVDRIKEIASKVSAWRNAVASGRIMNYDVYSDALGIDILTRVSAFLPPEVIASMQDLSIRDNEFFKCVGEIAHAEYLAIKEGKTLSEMELGE